MNMMKICKVVILVFIITFIAGSLSSCSKNKLITSGTLAPKPELFQGGIIQVYSARTWGAKQAVSVHTWISTKKSGADHYVSYEIIGWKLRRNNTALVVRENQPDRDWWGHQPKLLLDYRQADSDELIDRIAMLVEQYPYKADYQAFPGPNSNTFTASIARQVPELGLDLPSTAIGKDYKAFSQSFGLSPSGSGVQASLFGLFGITLGVEEGIELNILGLNFEFDIFDLAIELPGIGRIGSEPVKTISEPRQIENATESVTTVAN
jgi:hypothetical protein